MGNGVSSSGSFSACCHPEPRKGEDEPNVLFPSSLSDGADEIVIGAVGAVPPGGGSFVNKSSTSITWSMIDHVDVEDLIIDDLVFPESGRTGSSMIMDYTEVPVASTSLSEVSSSSRSTVATTPRHGSFSSDKRRSTPRAPFVRRKTSIGRAQKNDNPPRGDRGDRRSPRSPRGGLSPSSDWEDADEGSCNSEEETEAESDVDGVPLLRREDGEDPTAFYVRSIHLLVVLFAIDKIFAREINISAMMWPRSEGEETGFQKYGAIGIVMFIGAIGTCVMETGLGRLYAARKETNGRARTGTNQNSVSDSFFRTVFLSEEQSLVLHSIEIDSRSTSSWAKIVNNATSTSTTTAFFVLVRDFWP